jgi:hypothetical protein
MQNFLHLRWYDMIWYGDIVIWYDTIDTIWYDMMYDMIWYDIWYDDMIRYDRYDMIWYMTWYDMIWYDMIYICWLQLGSHPVAAVQYTFTHKQYTEQHNETEYRERNIHNNKNTQFTKLNRGIHNKQPYIYSDWKENQNNMEKMR